MDGMSRMVKFASQIDAAALKELRALSSETDKSISRLLSEAVIEYLKRARVRPEFVDAADKVLEQNSELLKRLAK